MSRILASGQVTPHKMSCALNVTMEKLDAYVAGSVPIPLNHQARLALFVIASLPTFLREGNGLRRQVAAAIAYETHQTETHNASSASAHRFPLSRPSRP